MGKQRTPETDPVSESKQGLKDFLSKYQEPSNGGLKDFLSKYQPSDTSNEFIQGITQLNKARLNPSKKDQANQILSDLSNKIQKNYGLKENESFNLVNQIAQKDWSQSGYRLNSVFTEPDENDPSDLYITPSDATQISQNIPEADLIAKVNGYNSLDEAYQDAEELKVGEGLNPNNFSLDTWVDDFKNQKGVFKDNYDNFRVGALSLANNLDYSLRELRQKSLEVFDTPDFEKVTGLDVDELKEKNLKQREENTKESGEKIQEIVGDNEFDNDWFARTISRNAPSSIPVFAGAAISTVNPVAGRAVMQAGFGGMSLASGGGYLEEYDQYVKEKGIEPNESERMLGFLGTMAVEYATERFGSTNAFFSKKMSKDIASGAIKLSSSLPVADKIAIGKAAVKDFAKRQPKKHKQFLKELAEAPTREGLGEVMAEYGNLIISDSYKEYADKTSTREAFGRMVDAFAAGAIMSAGVGPLSFQAQNNQTKARRQSQGGVMIGSYKGQGVEILQKTKSSSKDQGEIEEYQIMHPDGEVQKVNANEIEKIYRLSNEQFDNLLRGKSDETQALEESRKANQVAVRKEVDKLVDENLSEAKIEIDGQEFFIEGQVGDVPVYVVGQGSNGIYVVDQQTGKKKLVNRFDVKNQTNPIPVSQFKEILYAQQGADYIPNTPTPQTGESFEHPQLGEIKILSYDPSDGSAMVSYRNPEDPKNFIDEQIPRKQLDQLRGIQEETQVVNEQTEQAQEEEVVEELKEETFFDEDGNPIINPKQQSNETQANEDNAKNEEGDTTQEVNEEVQTNNQENQVLDGQDVPDVSGDKGGSNETVVKETTSSQGKTEQVDDTSTKEISDTDGPENKESGDTSSKTQPKKADVQPERSRTKGDVQARDGIENENNSVDEKDTKPSKAQSKKGEDSSKESNKSNVESSKSEKQGKDGVRQRVYKTKSDSKRGNEKQSSDSKITNNGFEKSNNVAETDISKTNSAEETISKQISQSLDYLPHLEGTDETNAYSTFANPWVEQQKQRVEKVVQKQLKKWKNPPKVKVFESALDLQIFWNEAFGRAQLRNPFGISGFQQGDTVYIVASNPKFKAEKNQDNEIMDTLLHEAFGHYGLRGSVGALGGSKTELNNLLKELSPEMDQTSLNEISNVYFGKDFSDINKGTNEYYTVLEEYIAHEVQKEAYDTPVQKVVQWFKDLLKKLGINLPESNLKQAIDNAKKYVRVGDSLVPNIANRNLEYPPNFQISAYHGSPHLFDKFSNDFVGSGSGKQRFGYGTYFTDKEGIAKAYANRLSEPTLQESAPEPPGEITKEELDKILSWYGTKYNVLNAIDKAKKNLIGKGHKIRYNDMMSERFNKKELKDYVEKYVDQPRHLYKVRLHGGKSPSEYDYLNWDKKVNATQLQKLQGIAEANPDRFKDATGQEVYGYLETLYGSQKMASMELLRVGIDGVQFPNSLMVKDGEGTNYVVFDDKEVDIEESVRFQVVDNQENINFTGDESNKKQVSEGQYQESIRKPFQTAFNDIRRNAESDRTDKERLDKEKFATLKYAKDNNLWIEDTTTLGDYMEGGVENTLFVNEKEGALYKSNNLMINQGSPLDLINRIQFHNALFPETAYELVGFTGLDNGTNRPPAIEVVLKQKFIGNARQATQKEIDSYMEKSGFVKDDDSFLKDGFDVSDLTPRNVLYSNGAIYVVDPFIMNAEPNNDANRINEDARFQRIGKNANLESEPIWNPDDPAEAAYYQSVYERKKDLLGPEPMFQKTESYSDLTSPVDNFYSNSLNALSKITQPKATFDQWKAMLLKNGASQTELDWIGFDELKTQGKSLAKEDVMSYIQENQVEVQEVVKTTKNTRGIQNGEYDRSGIIDGLNRWGEFFDDDNGSINLNDKGFYDVVINGEKEEFSSAEEATDYFLSKNDLKDTTKYSQYTLPGGENYKEVLLTMPFGKDTWGQYKNEISGNTYRSSHWDEPNILAHIRFNERTVGDEKVLFIEEIQSDWAQEGRKKGFKKKWEPNQLTVLDEESAKKLSIGENMWGVEAVNEQGQQEQVFMILKSKAPTEQDAIDYIVENKERSGSVPDMPFKRTQDWINLSMKKMIRYASENGFDRVAWVTGEQSAERYDLSKQVKEVRYNPEKQTFQAWKDEIGDEYAEPEIEESNVSPDKLEDYVGKEVAKKLIDAPVDKISGFSSLKGQDLQVGGEGMKAFYNKILPNTTSKLLKKLDKSSKVEPVDFANFEEWYKKERAESDPTWGEYENLSTEDKFEYQNAFIEDLAANKRPIKQLSFPITPLTRQKALQEGLPMFQKVVNMDDGPIVDLKRGDLNRIKIQDKMLYLKRLQETKAGDKMLDEWNAYEKETTSKGKINEWERVYNEEIWKPLSKLLMKIGVDVEKKGAKYDEVSRYLKAKHIFEDKIEAGGIPMAEAEQLVKDFESKVKKADVDKLHEMIKKNREFGLIRQYEGGLINQTTFNKYMGMYKYYVPLRGFTAAMGYDPTVFSGNFKRKGRTSESGDPIAYLEIMAKTDIIKSEQNKVKKAFYEFLKYNQDSRIYQLKNVWYVQNENGTYDVSLEKPSQELIDSKKATRKAPDMDNMTDEDLREFRMKHIFEGADSTITLSVDGRKVAIVFAGEGLKIAQAFKNLNVDKVPDWLKYNQAINTRLREMYTQYSPEFALRNFLRDYTAGVLNVKADYGAATAAEVALNTRKTFKAIKRGLLNNSFDGEMGRYFKEYLENGAMTGYSDIKQVKAVYRDLKSEVEGIKRNKVYKVVKAIPKFIDNTNRIIENSVRFSAYYTLRKKGISPQKAAVYAKDLTVNFNRKGEWTDNLNAAFLFFNASVQGNERLLRPYVYGGDKKTKIRAWGNVAGLAGANVFLSFIARSFGGEDDDGIPYYDKLSDYKRTHNIIFPNPLGSGDSPDDYFFMIPLPYGHNVPWALADIAQQAINGNITMKDATLSMTTAILESGSPIGAPDLQDRPTSEAFFYLLTPTAGKPVFDIMTNRNFASSPITPEPFSKLSPEVPNSQNYFDSVNPHIRDLTTLLNSISGGDEVQSGWIDINPEHVEHLLTSYTGGVGMFLNNTYITGVNLMKGENLIEKDNIRNIPFVRNYVTSVSPFHDSNRFYEILDETKKKIDIYKGYVNRGEQEKAKQFVEDNKKYFTAVAGGVPLYNSQKDRWSNPKGMSVLKDEAKKFRDKIKQIEAEIKTAKSLGRDKTVEKKKAEKEKFEEGLNQLYQRVYLSVEKASEK